MTKNRIGIALSVITIGVLMLGCGSFGATQVADTTGIVIDDYISGATVCVDVNNNGQRDTGDTPCAQTNATGQFNFGVAISNAHPLIMSGGTDVATGNEFTGTLSAPAGSKVLNPLTTIVQAIVASGKTTAEAQTIVKTSLGLDDVGDLTTYDPIATITSRTAAEVTTAKTVFAQQSSIQTILTTVATTIAASAGTNEANVTSRAAAQIAALMTASATPVEIDIADTTNVTTIINETAREKNTTVDATLVTALAAQVNATSDQVVSDIITTSTGTIGDIRQAAAQVAEVVQDNATAVATALVAGTDIATIVSTATTATTNLSTAIDDAAANVTPAASLTTVATTTSTPTPTTGGEGGTP